MNGEFEANIIITWNKKADIVRFVKPKRLLVITFKKKLAFERDVNNDISTYTREFGGDEEDLVRSGVMISKGTWVKMLKVIDWWMVAVERRVWRELPMKSKTQESILWFYVTLITISLCIKFMISTLNHLKVKKFSIFDYFTLSYNEIAYLLWLKRINVSKQN